MQAARAANFGARRIEPGRRSAVGPAVSDLIEHDPGSPTAVAAGCTCSQALNKDGAGTIGTDGRPRFVCDQDCPLHGLAVLKQAIENGEARIVEGAGPERDLPAEKPPTIH